MKNLSPRLKTVSLLLFLLFKYSLASETATTPSTNRVFVPALTLEAPTRDWGKLSFQRPSSFNANTSALRNALSITALPRFEIGSSPLLFTVKEHQFNFNLKGYFYKGERWHWAIGFSLLDMKIKDDVSLNTYKYRQSALSFTSNYFSSYWDLIFSATYTSIYGIITGDDLGVPEIGAKSEWSVDISKEVFTRAYLTFGVGQLRDKGYTPFENVDWHVAINGAYAIPNAWLSRPSLGVTYAPNPNAWGLLFSTTFF